MPATLSPLSLTSWQRRVVTTDYFQHAGYHVDSDTMNVLTPQGDVKYTITGQENPLKVAAKLSVNPADFTPRNDPLFSHKTVRAQLAWSDAIQQALIENGAKEQDKVIHALTGYLTAEKEVAVASPEAVSQLLTAIWQHNDLKSIQDKAHNFRYNKEYSLGLTQVITRTLDLSRLVDFSGGTRESMESRQRRIDASREKLPGFIIDQARSHLTHEIPESIFIINLQHMLAKSGLVMDGDNVEMMPNRFDISPALHVILQDTYRTVKKNDVVTAEARLKGLYLRHDPACEVRTPFAGIEEQIQWLAPVIGDATSERLSRRIHSEGIAPDDCSWLMALTDIAIKRIKEKNIEPTLIKNLSHSIPHTPSPANDAGGKDKEALIMRNSQKLRESVAFLESARDSWEATPIESSVNTFINDALAFDDTQNRVSPFASLHRDVSSYITSLYNALSFEDMRAASKLAQSDQSWRYVVANSHNAKRLNSVRTVPDLFNTLIAVSVISLSKEAGLLEPEPVKQIAEKPPELEEVATTLQPEHDAQPQPVSSPTSSSENDFMAGLTAAQDRIIEAMWRSDELVLEDENDWFEARWTRCVEEQAGDDKLRAAVDVFSELLEAPSKKAIKQWYIEDADHDVHATRLQEAAGKIKTSFADVDGMEALIDHHINTLSVVPGIISRTIPVNTLSRAADALTESLPLLEKQPKESVARMVNGVIEQISALPHPVSPEAMPWLDMEKAGGLTSVPALSEDADSYTLMSRFTQNVGTPLPAVPLPVNEDVKPEAASPVTSLKRA